MPLITSVGGANTGQLILLGLVGFSVRTFVQLISSLIFGWVSDGTHPSLNVNCSLLVTMILGNGSSSATCWKPRNGAQCCTKLFYVENGIPPNESIDTIVAVEL